MRRIGQLSTASEAERFCEYLVTESIDAIFDQSSDQAWDVWVKDESKLDQARTELQAFSANPGDPKFDVSKKASQIRSERSAAAARRSANVKNAGQSFKSPRRSAAAGSGLMRQDQMPLTIAIIVISVFVSFWTNSISNGKVTISSDGGQTMTDQAKVYVSMAFVDDRDLAETQDEIGQIPDQRIDEPREFFTSVRKGQVWRFITPMFIHLSMMHIAFNMLWMFQLGQILEKYHGTVFYAGLIVFCQVLAMLVQVLMPQWLPEPLRGSPYAFGASGVVYGVFGYLWIRPLVSTAFPIRIGNQTVYWMIGWLVLCFTGLLGNIANGAHLGGLLAGMLFAAVLPKKFS